MILTKDSLSTKNYVRSSRDLFEDVCDSRIKQLRDTRKVNILNYVKMIQDMREFIEGFIKYKEEGTGKYKDDVIATTVQFYNSMFTNEEISTKKATLSRHKEYRHKMYLTDFPSMMESFLKETKALQTIMEAHINESNIDPEMRVMLQITDNQYRKIAKVNRDDMAIFLWLSWNETFRADKYDIPSRLRMMFNDPNTPVMHLIKDTENN